MSEGAITLILLLTASVIFLAVVLWLVFRWLRKSRRQSRLDEAFERARKVRQSGSGLQGKPYNLYGESSWSDQSWRDN